ncbi:hypothetical protein BCR33DRAFT_727224 [Rhizoclosmatium globosum]|uniref:Uncharacterized protein n=1 Tax=Rhizoclosmatium globosum TaxID=329046 RepID=A0A1Y2AR83_9FUNG|nr:hypothetical protein BCR33DRAFT_727224 [Rhizoclosmatium globosum]|eukprot:ORY25042.1 hypothetical protein BCR33DRAFT_727224 [Rhizoclosmatium globosum]
MVISISSDASTVSTASTSSSGVISYQQCIMLLDRDVDDIPPHVAAASRRYLQIQLREFFQGFVRKRLVEYATNLGVNHSRLTDATLVSDLAYQVAKVGRQIVYKRNPGIYRAFDPGLEKIGVCVGYQHWGPNRGPFCISYAGTSRLSGSDKVSRSISVAGILEDTYGYIPSNYNGMQMITLVEKQQQRPGVTGKGLSGAFDSETMLVQGAVVEARGPVLNSDLVMGIDSTKVSKLWNLEVKLVKRRGESKKNYNNRKRAAKKERTVAKVTEMISSGDIILENPVAGELTHDICDAILIAMTLSEWYNNALMIGMKCW